MPLFDIRDVNFTKLKSLKMEHLVNFCREFSVPTSGDAAGMIRNSLLAFDNGRITSQQINTYIKNLHRQLKDAEMRSTGANHQAIINELNRVGSHIWGMVQGAVDQHIQANYVRKYFRYDDILQAVRSTLYQSIESYTLCTWYNHWSTEILEDLISVSPNVVPIIKKVKGVDIIWNEQPVDIKVTNLPKEWFGDGHNIDDAINNPVFVSEYLYRLQGAQRFGDDNRLFIIIYDKRNPAESWKIKRDYNLIKQSVENFFNHSTQLDPVNFRYGSTQYSAYSKILFIIKE
ncbi:MAG: hypothetical protein HY980_00110 [Candidatus Magasanikbacteria bacterium]|nr:hypothetical protein [Candidatus Magasanikbacteria bacterium]